MDADSIVKVLTDYKKIAGDHDWLKEVKTADVAIQDYLQTLKDLVEAQQYSRQAAKMIESLIVEVDEARMYIFGMEEEIKYLNDFVAELMEKLNELLHDEKTEKPVPK